MEKKRYEEIAYVLDFLPQGKARGRDFIAEPVVQIIGEEFFTLLEASLKRGITVTSNEKLYIGKEKRDKVNHIVGRISYEELTPLAKTETPLTVERIAKAQEGRFVQFFNTAQPITPRMHMFELLPGIGKKYMWQIVNEREKRPFNSFADISARTGIPDPAKIIARRIVEELTAEQKYRLFTRPL